MVTGDTFSPGYKIWLEKNGGVQGDGFFQLLEYINQTGSISGAASAMGMSYRAAWGKIKAAEKKWGMDLVTTRVGGETGGGARLTPEAGKLLRRYYRFRETVEREISNIFIRIFND
ncbi:winged helix-turn-helix domain-containing protein [Desulfoscipio geothermicus]|uniref:Molybdate transport system regulatory protein n=1 Tax=Desulfoscipio geothermicus DSM 3669 TaxID=1121426 RepID=A0A1I6D2F8_9FIRM|nr:LysR family transcriptional regulator [Desulfoscipio geothermicus]SFQ99659.1 molybdate transport system regulatory protein [Desulfoscipio geothermicus DSM 3669]